MHSTQHLHRIYWINFITVILAAFLKIRHQENATFFLIIGLILSVLFVVLALMEVYSSKNISSNEKFMWTIGLILMSTLVGLIYIVKGRNRVLKG
jgi:uncharacterized membrane protein YfhO